MNPREVFCPQLSGDFSVGRQWYVALFYEDASGWQLRTGIPIEIVAGRKSRAHREPVPVWFPFSEPVYPEKPTHLEGRPQFLM
jgi:hypothetical protein